MNEKNESAASAADEGAAAKAAAERKHDNEYQGNTAAPKTDAVIHPTQPPVPIDPVPTPNAIGATDDVMAGVENTEQRFRYVTLGDTVLYGDGTGQVWPAIVAHVYDPSFESDANNNIVGAQAVHLDLWVFKRKHITDVEKVEYHHFDPPRSLNGWIFKA